MEENVKKIESLPGKTGNKVVYLVKITDQEGKQEYKWFVTTKTNIGGATIEFIGYEVEKEKVHEIKTYDDALNIASSSWNNNPRLVEVIYPISRLVRVINLSYKVKS